MRVAEMKMHEMGANLVGRLYREKKTSLVEPAVRFAAPTCWRY